MMVRIVFLKNAQRYPNCLKLQNWGRDSGRAAYVEPRIEGLG